MNKNRKSLGKTKKGILAPVPPLQSEMDTPYFELRDHIIKQIKDTRLRFVMHANSGMIELYWHIGNEILQRQELEGWGAKVIDRLSVDLKDAFPEMTGFSPRNLKYMRKFAETWPDSSIVQQPVAQLQWRSILMLLTKLKNNTDREWYAQKVLENGWSSNVLSHMIEICYMERKGKAVTNFSKTLPPPNSDMAVQIFKDPYIFDFVGTAELRRESEVEASLIKHIEKFLLELGQGFAFVGRQFHLEVGGDDFYLDLLFYHLKLRCYVVVELKVRDFEPEHVGQLSMYQNIVNDILRHPDDKPTIGLLLVKDKNRTVVEYSLAGYTNPIGVANWENKMSNILPDDLKSSLPTIEEIEKEIDLAEAKINKNKRTKGKKEKNILNDYEELEFDFKIKFEINNMTEELYYEGNYFQYLSSPIIYKKYSEKDEIIVEEEIGKIELIYLHGTKAYNNELDIVDICDSESQELYDYSSCIYQDGYINEKYNDFPRSNDVLILDSIKIDKSYQGKGYGIIISNKVIEMFGYNCGAILINTFPLQHSAGVKEDNTNKKYISGRFGKDLESCRKKIIKYWKQICNNCIQIKMSPDEIVLCIPQS